MLSLNKGTREQIAKVLRASGLGANASQKMAARILDYVDEDNSRQFLGGERADYRLRSQEPPTNEPLRNFEELARVLGWKTEAKALDVDTFKSLTTIQLTDGLKQKFVPPKLASILGMESSDGPAPLEASLDNLGGLSSTPSGSFRLCFTLYNHFDKEDHRCIEVNRKAQHVDKPFQRHSSAPSPPTPAKSSGPS